MFPRMVNDDGGFTLRDDDDDYHDCKIGDRLMCSHSGCDGLDDPLLIWFVGKRILGKCCKHYKHY